MKRMLHTAVLLALASINAPALAGACWSGEERSASVDATGVKLVVINAGPGSLQIRGERSLTSVEASGDACASADRYLEEIRIDQRREGDTIYLETQFPDIRDGLIGITRYASLDLVVRVPEEMAIRLADTSGSLSIRRVRSASIQDGSGNVDARNIAGDFDILDSSGSIDIRDVGGTVRLRDGSGNIEIARVKGDVEILIDGSGEIEIERISGNVHVRTDGSGSIEIEHVKGNVHIDNDGSGHIEVEDVDGDLTIGTAGSGGIDHSRVKGKVSLPHDRD